MLVATVDLATAREITEELLNELELDAYLFEIEPHNDLWLLRIECAIDQGWETVSLSIPADVLFSSRDNENAHQYLLDNLRTRLTACKRQKN